MRGLSHTFLERLKFGFLSGITDAVKRDNDLNLEIRDGYINIYYKGSSLLNLTEVGSSRYKVDIDKKFLHGIDLPSELTEKSVADFLASIPLLKQNIATQEKQPLEVEFEQMLIRANNFESRNNSEYFIVDRQYAIGRDRFDLTGIYWDRNRRRRNQEVPICLMEIKYALNPDISDVHNQLARYYEAIRPIADSFAEELQIVFRQKLELGLYQLTQQQSNAMQTLSFSRKIEQFQFIVVLVDYNPNSSKLDLQKLIDLPFASQVKVFFSGFAMWQQNVKPLSSYLAKQ